MEAEILSAAISQRIRKFLSENYLFGYAENEFGDDDSFMELGVLDSTAILELIAFIEEEFEINIDDSEIIPDNMDSINRLSHFVYKKTR